MALKEDMRRLRRNPHIVIASLAANLLGLALPLTMIQVYDRIIPKQGFETLTVLSLGLLGAAIAEFGIRMARGHLMAIAGVRFETYAYEEAFRRMLLFGTAQGQYDQGTYHDKIASIERVRKHHGSDAATALLDVPFIIVFVAVMSLISPLLGLAICGFTILSLGVVWFQRGRILELNHDRQDRDRRRHSFLIETLEGIEMIKSLGIEALMQRRYERLMSVSTWITHEISGRINITQGITAAVGLMAPVFMSGIGSMLVLSGQMSVGGLAAAVLLTGRVIQPTLRIEALLAGERDTKRSEQDVQDLVAASTPHQGTRDLDRITEISMQNVSLVPGDDGKRVLRNMTFTLRKGDCAVIGGGEGSGRSLFLSLIAGHHAASSGRVLINGRPIGDFAGDALDRRITLLSAEFTLLEGTLLENMTAFEVARHSEAAFALSEELGIKDFISRHSDGLSMRVAARAATSLPKSVHDSILIISGLVRGPDVILFDEANAGLDRETDLRMIEVLRRRRPESIIVMVTHRPSYKALANRHFLLRDGILTEKTLIATPRQVASRRCLAGSRPSAWPAAGTGPKPPRRPTTRWSGWNRGLARRWTRIAPTTCWPKGCAPAGSAACPPTPPPRSR